MSSPESRAADHSPAMDLAVSSAWPRSLKDSPGPMEASAASSPARVRRICAEFPSVSSTSALTTTARTRSSWPTEEGPRPTSASATVRRGTRRAGPPPPVGSVTSMRSRAPATLRSDSGYLSTTSTSSGPRRREATSRPSKAARSSMASPASVSPARRPCSFGTSSTRPLPLSRSVRTSRTPAKRPSRTASSSARPLRRSRSGPLRATSTARPAGPVWGWPIS